MTDKNKPSVLQRVISKVNTFAGGLAITITIVTGSIAISAYGDGFSSERLQKEALYKLHPEVKEILYTWNAVADIDDNDKNGVRYIKQNLKNVLEQYKNLNVSELSEATKISHSWHLARLQVVLSDIYSESSRATSLKAINEALDLLNKVEVMKSGKLTNKDYDYLKKIKIDYRVNRTRLVALAFKLHLTNDDDVRRNASRLLDQIGGCDELVRENTSHIKLLKALSCDKQDKTKKEALTE